MTRDTVIFETLASFATSDSVTTNAILPPQLKFVDKGIDQRQSPCPILY